MGTIRPFERADLPAVTALMEARLPGWLWGESLLAETLVDHPWADPEIPSLVAVDDDEVIGFMGAQVRRMRIDDRAIRGVCCSHLVVADRATALTGARLVRKMLSGPQDLSWTDSATDTVMRMWGALGAYFDHTRACDWMLVLRPARWVAAALAARARRATFARDLTAFDAVPLQALRPGARRNSHIPEAGVSGSDPGIEGLIEALPSITADARLRVDYDAPHLEGVFSQIRTALGPPTRRVVIRDGSPIGWYAYVPQEGGIARVLHVSTLEREADAVLGDLIDHARTEGVNLLTGRAEPYLGAALKRRGAGLGYSRHRQLVIHTRDSEIRELLASSSSRLTSLDGEWFVT
jgi:hypothetical protein